MEYINHRKQRGWLCPECMEEKIFRKNRPNAKYICKNCNMFVNKKELIRMPISLTFNKINRYQEKLEEFKKRVKDGGDVKDFYMEIEIEVE